MSDLVLRRACDRCHAQKLSCQREGDTSCLRCAKASATCTTSPSLRHRGNRKPRGSTVSRPRSAAPSDSSNDTNKAMVQQTFSFLPGWAADEQLFGEGLDWVDETLLQPSAPGSDHPHDELSRSDSNTDISHLDSGISCSTPNHFGMDIAFPSPHGDFRSTEFMVSELSSPTAMTRQVINSLRPMPSSGSTTIVEAEMFDDLSKSSTYSPAKRRRDDSDETLIRRHEERSGAVDGQWLLQLAEINVKLFSMAKDGSLLLVPDDRDGSTANSSEQSYNTDESIRVAFDNALGLFSQFLRLLRRLDSNSNANPGISPDLGSVIMIMSCYIRVLEVTTDLLGVIKRALASSKAKQPPAHMLPSICVSSIMLDEFPSLQSKLSLELIKGILEALKSVLVPIVQGNRAGMHREAAASRRWEQGFQGVPKDLQQTVQCQEQATYQLIEAIRQDLEIFHNSAL